MLLSSASFLFSKSILTNKDGHFECFHLKGHKNHAYMRTREVIGLSRQNTNVKSFELSLGRKRKITAQCDEILSNLQEALRSKEFKATR